MCSTMVPKIGLKILHHSPYNWLQLAPLWLLFLRIISYSLSSSLNTFSTLSAEAITNFTYLCGLVCCLFSFIISLPTWHGIVIRLVLVAKYWFRATFFFFKSFINYLKVPPNVGVQYSTVGSWVIGNVLETGTKHSPLPLRSCFGPSASLDLPELYKNNKN